MPPARWASFGRSPGLRLVRLTGGGGGGGGGSGGGGGGVGGGGGCFFPEAPGGTLKVQTLVVAALPGVAWRTSSPDAAGAAVQVDVVLPGIEASTLRLQRLGSICAALKNAEAGRRRLSSSHTLVESFSST